MNPLRLPSFLVMVFVALLVGSVSAPAHVAVKPFSSSFKTREMAITDSTQYLGIGGKGPAVLLLHGFDDTGDMWQPLADLLVKDHTVRR
jgi:pimeloyl-ACP methyl ester carboxylesterase